MLGEGAFTYPCQWHGEQGYKGMARDTGAVMARVAAGPDRQRQISR
jgi:hypothetical protein